jgi:lipoyl-dependent peroxiredoxin
MSRHRLIQWRHRFIEDENSSPFNYLTKESIMSKIQKVLLTGKTYTTSPDGRMIAGDHEGNVDINLSVPGNSTARVYGFEAVAPHPAAEQLFAGAWSACYLAAVGIVAKEKKVSLPGNTALEVEVDLGLGGGAYHIQGRINLIVPGLDNALALEIAHAADAICPYSKATRGNIDVALSVTTE